MAYFNNAFQKVFLGTGSSANPSGFTGLNLGQLGTTGNQLAAGEFAFVDPKTWILQDPDQAPANCCPLILASGSVLTNDKIGPFHGGYLESNKSKIINPRYVNKFYRVDPCPPIQAVLNIGVTPHTSGGVAEAIDNLVGGTGYTNGTYNVAVIGGTGSGAIIEVTVVGGIVQTAVLLDGGFGYTDGDTLTLVGGNNDAEVDVDGVTAPTAGCCPDFLCGETYYLRLDVKGSPALRFLNHNAYLNVSAYTGCCPAGAIAPTPVDSTEVMIAWAKQIVESPLISPFILPVVSDQNGNIWYAPGTVDVLGNPVLNTWDNYVSPGYLVGECAGLILYGAYVDTKFGNCTFQVSDFYEKEPVRLYASEVDLNGDPCTFTGICIVNECLGTQAMGLGESVVRDLILSESYRQNFFHSDFRIREITQGYDILNTINRNALYTRYYLLHSVPRHNNPTGTFDNDQYLLEVITDAPVQAFEDFVNDWVVNCSQCDSFEAFGCESFCEPDVPIVPLPQL